MVSALMRRDTERSEREAYNRLRAELVRAFAAPDSSFHPLSAADVIARNRARPGETRAVRVQEAIVLRIDRFREDFGA